jgi:hypothetical protein
VHTRSWARGGGCGERRANTHTVVAGAASLPSVDTALLGRWPLLLLLADDDTAGPRDEAGGPGSEESLHVNKDVSITGAAERPHTRTARGLFHLRLNFATSNELDQF